MHHVAARSLRPATKYYFICGADDVVGWSKEHTFTTRPAHVESFTAAVLGDMGIENSADTMKRLTARVKSNAYDFLYLNGDQSYADDHVFHFERTWLAYLRMVTDAQLFSTPWMCSPGNHEWASRDPFLYRATRNF